MATYGTAKLLLFQHGAIFERIFRMNRYLLNISYIGTHFRGIQKTVNKLEESRVDTTTIQGCLELALKTFRPINEIQTVLSSRTDAGVHALHNTLHVDLQRYDSKPYDEATLTGVLNRTLCKQNLAIRVLSVRRVPDDFHCRYNALGRTYLYRIAVAKNGWSNTDCNKNRNFECFLPVDELDRCFFIQTSTFDVERFQRAASLLIGRHDFRTFTSTSRQMSVTRMNPMFTVRKVCEINLLPGQCLAFGPNAEQANELYNYWTIEIKAKSFLYKQVRRMVGTLLAVASGRIDERQVYEMLTIPSKHSWLHQILISPAFGLYLGQVHYNEQDLQLPTQ